MRIDHIAIWVDDLEKMRDFYLQYFDTTSGDLYVNPAKKFSSYFISFEGGGSRVELMNRHDISKRNTAQGLSMGLTHLAFTVGSRERVDEMVEIFRKNGLYVHRRSRRSC